jgi:hypothetical protein
VKVLWPVGKKSLAGPRGVSYLSFELLLQCLWCFEYLAIQMSLNLSGRYSTSSCQEDPPSRLVDVIRRSAEFDLKVMASCTALGKVVLVPNLWIVNTVVTTDSDY